jgi:hypothetical protein
LQRPLSAQGVRDTIRTRRDSTTIAVPVPQRADSLLRDSLAIIQRRDSLAKLRRADSIKAATAHAPQPPTFDIGRLLHWNRDSLFATGAVTLADLLDRVTGVTTLRGGWLSSPTVAAYEGDVKRVRVFFDGLEYLPLDPRGNGVLDLTQINLWGAEELTIEQAPEEVRIYVRTWRVRSTTPQTRTDVSTGDQQTNMYRGFFGQRFDNGLALQFAAQQYSTAPPTALGTGSDQTGIIGRVGWAKGSWSVDGFLSRINRRRGSIFHQPLQSNSGNPTDSLRGVSSARNDAYLRLGYGDPDTSVMWAQAMVASSNYRYTGVRTLTIVNPRTPADSAFNTTDLDTTSTRGQYVFTAGTTRGPLQLSATERLIAGAGTTYSVPSLRGTFMLPFAAVSGFLEGKDVDSVSHMDLTAAFTPTSFTSLLGGVGRTSDSRRGDSSFSAMYYRAEAGLRVHNLWLVGGVLHRDSTLLSPPTIFNPANPDSALNRAVGFAATGATFAIRGQLWRIVHADVSAIRWNDTTGFYRPRYQTRSELFVRTNLLRQIPSGDFGLLGSIVHEYRSSTNFPIGGTVVRATGYRTLSTLLEIRILNATISWQFRNILGYRYEQVPGLIMNRQLNFYGVRWNFFD